MRREEMKELFEALMAADEAFEKHLSEEIGVDPGYYDLRMTGYVLDQYEFQPLECVKILPTYESENLGYRSDTE